MVRPSFFFISFPDVCIQVQTWTPSLHRNDINQEWQLTIWAFWIPKKQEWSYKCVAQRPFKLELWISKMKFNSSINLDGITYPFSNPMRYRIDLAQARIDTIAHAMMSSWV